MTEAEARLKWCPLSRTVLERESAEVVKDHSSFNRTLKIGATGNNTTPVGECIGSRCALWRWAGSRSLKMNVDPGWTPDNTSVQTGECGLTSLNQSGVE